MTLIEVLITIVVFSVGILTILSIITGSLSLWSRSRNRTTATMLAKEWIEMMYSIRDTNLDKAQKWWCIPPINTNVCAYDLVNWSYTFIIDRDSDGIAISVPATFDKRRLYINSSNGVMTYTHSGTSTPSSFYRYLTIKSTVGMPGDTTVIDANMKKIISTVEYMQLWWTGKVELESFIGLTR
jgi:type II secretory pathway pseudopilin PulG